MTDTQPSAPPPPGRVDGYVPLEAYAVLGDGRSAALVARDGTIDWWPAPTIDAPPIFAAIIDPHDGGSFRLAPDDDHTATRRYVADTNVLETTFTTPTGTVRVTDVLNVGAAGRLPWSELARRIDGLDGTVTLSWEVQPGDRFGQAQPVTGTHQGVPIIHLADQQLAVVATGPEPAVTDTTVTGRLEVSTGDRHLVALAVTDDEPLCLPSAQAVDARIDRSIATWQQWTAQVDYDGPWRDNVVRSALALKTLLYEPGGAIAAAATTSLPERIGGPKNWDYRYAWVRDTSFTLDALIALGLHEEVHGAVSWLLAALRRSAPDLHVFYTLDGATPGDEDRLDVPGYRQSRPVRAGNGASEQIQLGCYGDLFDTINRYVDHGHLLDPATSDLLTGYADHCAEHWADKDSGIWELGDLRHYTISKIGCWVALDRAARLAQAGQLDADRALRWRDAANTIKEWVGERCWSEAKQAYTFHADTDDLDAAVLLAGRTGFDTGPRLATTVDAIAAELGVPGTPYLYRYTGMAEEEGAFVACTFWMIDALARTGRTSQARQLMDQATGMANEVGILAEQADPATAAALGNLPQGLSHLALINAATTLARGCGKDQP